MRRCIIVLSVLALAGTLTGCAPTGDKVACRDYSDIIKAYSAHDGKANAQAAASKMQSQVIPAASAALAADVKVIAGAFAAYRNASPTSADKQAEADIEKRCAAVGVGS